MQEIEKKEKLSPAPADPKSEPLQSVCVPGDDSLHLAAAEADEIFKLAEAEIKPLLKKAKRDRWTGRVQSAFCLCLIIGGLIGTIYGAINYPKTVITIFPVERSTSITTALSIPLRTLSPVTVTKSLTIPTTGKGHQDARSAAGTLTFYNGSESTQTVAIGTVFIGNDGVKVTTDQTVTVPPADLPQVGEAAVSASALVAGNQGNIAAYDINVAVSSDLRVKDMAVFTGGRDARDYKAVAPQDIQSLTATLQQTLTQAMPQAFQLAPGEALTLTHCLFTDTPDHQLGDEAATVTLHASDTCQGHANNAQELTTRATTVFTTSMQPAPPYRLLGTVQAHVTSVSPMQVTISGTWIFTISTDYEAALAEKIAGDTPAQARSYLLHTGVIAQATISSTLPEAMDIKFLVLVEM